MNLFDATNTSMCFAYYSHNSREESQARRRHTLTYTCMQKQLWLHGRQHMIHPEFSKSRKILIQLLALQLPLLLWPHHLRTLLPGVSHAQESVLPLCSDPPYQADIPLLGVRACF